MDTGVQHGPTDLSLEPHAKLMRQVDRDGY